MNISYQSLKTDQNQLKYLIIHKERNVSLIETEIEEKKRDIRRIKSDLIILKKNIDNKQKELTESLKREYEEKHFLINK